MYIDYYNFTKEPFNITPDIDFFYCSKHIEDILDLIEYQLSKRRGFILLTGDVGTGKTLISRVLLNKLQRFNSSLILNPFLNYEELLFYICKDFGIINDNESVQKGQLFHLLAEFLIKEYKQGKNCIIIVDEAQNLSFESFEMIRQISNIELEDTKLVQILFIGQTELIDKINSTELRQLKQRISSIVELTPLDIEDTTNYIHFRTQEALKYKRFIFSDSAIKAIYSYTNGSPREINQLCHSSLIIAASNDHKSVTQGDVEYAASDYYGKFNTTKKFNISRYIYLTIVILIILIALSFYYSTYLAKPSAVESIKMSPRSSSVIQSSDNISDNTSINISAENSTITPQDNISDNDSLVELPSLTDTSPTDSTLTEKSISNKVEDDNLTNFKKGVEIIAPFIDNSSVKSKEKRNQVIASNRNLPDNITKPMMIFIYADNSNQLSELTDKLKQNSIDFYTRKKSDGRFVVFLGTYKVGENINKMFQKLEKLGIYGAQLKEM